MNELQYAYVTVNAKNIPNNKSERSLEITAVTHGIQRHIRPGNVVYDNDINCFPLRIPNSYE